MSNHTYRVTEIVGTSPDGVDAAIRSGIKRASQTLRGLDWFEVGRSAVISTTARSSTCRSP